MVSHPPSLIFSLSLPPQAVKYVHDAGYVHRDIKAGNFLLTADLQVKIADFGVATKVPKRCCCHIQAVIDSADSLKWFITGSSGEGHGSSGEGVNRHKGNESKSSNRILVEMRSEFQSLHYAAPETLHNKVSCGFPKHMWF